MSEQLRLGEIIEDADLDAEMEAAVADYAVASAADNAAFLSQVHHRPVLVQLPPTGTAGQSLLPSVKMKRSKATRERAFRAAQLSFLDLWAPAARQISSD